MSVRLAAARALLALDRRDGTLGAVLEHARQPEADDRDLALLTELITGVLRWRNELDAVIASAGRRSVRTIDPTVLAVLRLGAYQLRHLDRIPEHAIVHESVQTVRTLGTSSASGFVNAVLRAIIRRGPAISLPARPTAGPRDAEVNYLTTTWSHPAWLVRRWIERMGFEAAESWCHFNNSIPDVTVRALDGTPAHQLIAELRAHDVPAEPAQYVADALKLPAGALGRMPLAMRARLWVQDEGAQLVAAFARVQPGERVLDLCAAPGGKSLVFADRLAMRQPSDVLRLVAADHRERRVALLAETFRRARLPVPVVRLDGESDLPFGAIFDCVVVDAPCSGLGTLRREPDLKWTRTAEDLPLFAASQRRMLAKAADVVRPGGRLVYATCSSEPEENAEVADAFLREDARFVAADLGAPRDVAVELTDSRGQLATRPDEHRLESFYAAVLVRREGT